MNSSLLIKSPLCRCTSQHPALLYASALTALLTIPLQQAVAGGFQLPDHSISSLGRNHAGYGVVGDDASAVQFNPAGLTLLKKPQVQVGLNFSTLDAEVENNGSNAFGGAIAGPNEDGTGLVTVPLAYYVQPTDEKFVFGIGITAPFGTSTDYSSKRDSHY